MTGRSIRLSAPIAILLAALTQTLASPAANPALEQAGQDLRQGAITLDVSTLQHARAELDQLARTQPQDSNVALQLARADNYLAAAYQLRGDRSQFAQALKTATNEVRQAISLDPKSAVAHAMYADLMGWRLSQGGMILAIRNGPTLGPKLNGELATALQLSPHNAYVLECMGRKYLYAPRMFGGDVNKAVESFRQAAALAPGDPEALTWLGTALAAQGSKQQARQEFENALKISPQFALARQRSSITFH